jgi:hypothetical protein
LSEKDGARDKDGACDCRVDERRENLVFAFEDFGPFESALFFLSGKRDLTERMDDKRNTHDLPGSFSAKLNREDAVLEGNPKRQRSPIVQRLDLPGGVLDDSILSSVSAICQQLNCVGCDGRGLAEGVAKKLPYGCSYKDRKPMKAGSKFAVVDDRATPGTIDVRGPPAGIFGSGTGRPVVINMFAQWEMGSAGKYNRVSPAPPSDSAETRELWFAQCLDEIAKISPRPSSLAFPYEIGCGLAGGRWEHYERMLLEFAERYPDIEVFICRWTGGVGGAENRGKSARGSGKGGKGQGGRSTCFKCGGSGHWANACTQGGKP